MHVIDGIILDVDGTIWDSVSICTQAWNKVIQENSDYPPNITDEKLKALFGKPMDDIFRALFPTISDADIERLGKLCEHYENQVLEDHPGMPYGDVKGTIKELSARIPVFIVSNCQSGYIEVCMKTLGLEKYITDYTCFGNRPVSKGQNIKFLMEKNGLQSPVYVGDTYSDELACEEAGIPMIFASYGFGDVKKPYAVIERFEDLVKLFG